MARILGLDLGSYAVKAVIVETTYRNVAVKHFVSVPVAAAVPRIEALKAALQNLGEQTVHHVDSIVISVPGTALATHSIELPFSEPKKVESALAFEVESQLPFDLDEAVFDHHVCSADERGAQLLVGVMKKRELSPLLELLHDQKLDARVVTHAGLAYQQLFPLLPQEGVPHDAAVAVVDIGHERCSVAIGNFGGSVEFARTFAGGGLSLSKALAQEFQVSLADAQKWKEEHGALGSAARGADAERAAVALARALQPVWRDLRATLKAYTARFRRPVGAVWLCGGTSMLPGLSEQLSRDLQLPVRRLELPPDVQTVLGLDRADTAQAYALALRGGVSGAKASRFNLRRGEFALKSDFDFVAGKMGQIAALAAVLFVLLIASGMVRNAILERKDNQLKAALCDVTQRILGKCETDYAKAQSMLQGKESPAAGIPEVSATTLLAELTGRVPQNLNVTFEQVVIDLERISLRAETENSKNLEDLITALKTYKCFREVNEGRVEKNKDGTKVSTRLDIQVDCSEVAPKAEG